MRTTWERIWRQGVIADVAFQKDQVQRENAKLYVVTLHVKRYVNSHWIGGYCTRLNVECHYKDPSPER